MLDGLRTERFFAACSRRVLSAARYSPKLCADCRHFYEDASAGTVHCAAVIDMINGRPLVDKGDGRHWGPAYNREKSFCGIEGRMFEPKISA